jgi:hypothetical protein
VSEYRQADSLSTVTDIPMSGTGTATGEGAAANASYSTWQWELALATVLGVPIPDRSEVIGQPWLTIVTTGQAAPASHQIWTASWNDKPDSGAESIAIYLNPQLYTTGGAWDQFENTPAAVMSAVAAGSYTTLMVNPRTFQSARVGLADVMTELGSLAQQFQLLNHQATAETTGFQGTMAGVAADLFGALRAVALSLQDQMTSPNSYSDVMGTTGDSAAAFLASMNTAYNGWLQVPAHSPLGAIVSVLEAIATPDGNGGYAIPNPQDTTYGDLTTSGPWAAVEQQAKNVWTGALAGDAAGFGGLDPLGQSALTQLAAQYNTAISALVPVVGPAPPPIKPATVNYSPTGGGPHVPDRPGPLPVGNTAGGLGGSGSGGPGLGGPGSGGPVPVPVPAPISAYAVASGAGGKGNLPTVTPIVTRATVNLPADATGGGAGSAIGGGPVGGGLTGGGSGAAAPLVFPVGLAGSNAAATGQPGGSAVGQTDVGLDGPDRAAAVVGPEGQPPAGQVPSGEATGGLLDLARANAAVLPAGQPAAGAASSGLSSELADGAPAADGLAIRATALAGAIGADAPAPRATAAIPEDLAFGGTIGQPGAADDDSGRGKAGDRESARLLGHNAAADVRQAPTAGFALGRDISGGALARATVPVVQDKPQAVLASSINGQLTPAAAGNSGLSSAPGMTGGAPVGHAVGLGESGSSGLGYSGLEPGHAAGLAAADQGGIASPGGGSTELTGTGAATGSGEGVGGTGQMMDPGMGMGMPGMGMGGMGGMGMGGMGRGGRGQRGQERQRLAYLPEDEEYWGTAPPVNVGVVRADVHDDIDDIQEPEFRIDPSHLAGIGADDERGLVRNSRPDRRMP